VSAAKKAAALTAVLDKLLSIEAAMQDAVSPEFTSGTHAPLDNAVYKRRCELRIHTAALSVWHLSDAVKRLAKRSGVDVEDVKQFCAQENSIRVLQNLSNSQKHGLGGTDKQSCFLNGFVTVHRLDKPEEVVAVLGMVITDGKEGVFPSMAVLHTAIRAWGAWLEQRFGIAQDWVARCIPKSGNAPIVMLKPDEHVTVEQGTILLAALPDELSERLRAEAVRRGESA